MKISALLLATIINVQLGAQSKTETVVLNLSRQLFTWEVDNKTDSLANLFDEKCLVIGSNGDHQSKQQYIARLKSGNFIHNKIEVEEDTVVVANNTAIVAGKGRFSVTVSGNNKLLHLSYTEVFTRARLNKNWKLLLLHASLLDH